MIRFTHSICVARKGDRWNENAPTIYKETAATFTVSWNCRNLQIESNTLRPQITAFTTEAKSSSSKIMSLAFLATLVPHRPITSPTSYFCSAGASLVPSPVTPTTSPIFCSPETSWCLSVGDHRASTFIWSATKGKFFIPSLSAACRNSPPVMAKNCCVSVSSLSSSVSPSGRCFSTSPMPPSSRSPASLLACFEPLVPCLDPDLDPPFCEPFCEPCLDPMPFVLFFDPGTLHSACHRSHASSSAKPSLASRMPHCRAIALAVSMLSPVTMRTSMPHRLQS